MRVRIGTRGSSLALAQANEVADLLRAGGAEPEVVPIVTSGDRGASPASSPAGVKGLFVAEITDALLRGDVEVAVHSAKDLPSEDPEGIAIGAVPLRSLPYDVLVSRGPDVEAGARVGTSSLRRQAQLRRSRPDVEVVDIRGNVDTRLSKLEEGGYDALVLAAAGLSRLGIAPEHAMPLPLDDMVPAPGQGALAIQVKEGSPVTDLVAEIDHEASRVAFEAERRLVRLLDAGCALPLGAYAERRTSGVRLMAVVVRPDGSDLAWAQVEAPGPDEVAEQAAEILFAGGAAEILRSVGS